ncbi:cob(I)alamin adenosyltransferase [Spiroplasma chinense]|uniref:Cob(I)alamin adenosyltransferase n=1 Tax=Spiroplasma chinense TaxID=216932 RepID=A0A5B9Y6A4_9MOLU|nr:cob(I)yrinic acid a,c-diamide adenosyltransferase [Spiroplasma chinense]QEH62256.1 cob(I)alamin adenosyltransferase [Spiroplasma chinense]
MNKKGCFHIYYGNGKGKTSVLNGMCLRAKGSNMNVKYLRFLKNMKTSENDMLSKIGVEVENFYHFSKKFIWDMNPQEVEEFKVESLKGLERLEQLLQDESVDLILVDELLGVIENGFFDKEHVVKIINNRKSNIEIAVSGRVIYEQMSEIADLISEVKEIKHYYEKGVTARKGIEY